MDHVNPPCAWRRAKRSGREGEEKREPGMDAPRLTVPLPRDGGRVIVALVGEHDPPMPPCDEDESVKCISFAISRRIVRQRAAPAWYDMFSKYWLPNWSVPMRFPFFIIDASLRQENQGSQHHDVAVSRVFHEAEAYHDVLTRSFHQQERSCTRRTTGREGNVGCAHHLNMATRWCVRRGTHGLKVKRGRLKDEASLAETCRASPRARRAASIVAV